MGIREDEKIAPHCEFIHVHDKVVKQVMDVMPEGEELQNLAEFFRIFGDSTRIRISPSDPIPKWRSLTSFAVSQGSATVSSKQFT